MSRPIKVKTESNQLAFINVDDVWYNNNVIKLFYTYQDAGVSLSFKHRDKAYYETDELVNNTKWTELITNPEIIQTSNIDMDEYSTTIINMFIQLQVTNSMCTTLKNDFYHNPNTEDGLLDISDPNWMSNVSETTVTLYNSLFSLAGVTEDQGAVVLLLLSFIANLMVTPEFIYNQTGLNVRKMLIEPYQVTIDNIRYTFMYDQDDPDHYAYYTDEEIVAALAPYSDPKYKVVEATPISTELSDVEKAALAAKYPELSISAGIESTQTEQIGSMYSNIAWKFYTTNKNVPSELPRDFSLAGNSRIIGGVKINGEYVENNAQTIDSSTSISTYAPYDWTYNDGGGSNNDNALKVHILNSRNLVRKTIIDKVVKIDGPDHSDELPQTNDIDVSEIQPGEKLSIETVVGKTICLSGDTLITMYDRTTKRLDEIKPGDIILAYHNGKYVPDRVKFTDSMANKVRNDLIIYYFDHCAPLKVIRDHRLFNCRLNRFTHLSEFQIGDETLNSRGEKVKLLRREYYDVPTQHYTIFTNKYNTYFANDMLAGNIFSNMKTSIIFKLYYYLKLKWEMKSYERQNNRKNGATSNR